ncbi:MAG: ADP-ribosylglycohydrolase family protein [Fibrobacter sp.]|nr:ADP-ribosylglycohydrolase family protein [Fibrobacter sp.]
MTEREKRIREVFRNAASNMLWGDFDDEPLATENAKENSPVENNRSNLKKDTCLLGAIAGDTIGSPYEFDSNNYKGTDFPLFNKVSEYTDDSVMTVAVANAVMMGFAEGFGGEPDAAKDKFDAAKDKPDEQKTEEAMVFSMRSLGRRFPYAGYGGRFCRWLESDNPQPYNSWGNGSAMRVSAVGWAYDTLEEVEKYAEISARVTHNHPEGIKGAKAVAAAIFLGRAGKSKQEILDYVERTYGYAISQMTCDKIRPGYHMNESCQGTVPQAFCAFREGNSFEEVARLAVSLGGDSDTLCCIACAMAEAVYGIPEDIQQETINRLPEELLVILNRFQKFVAEK